MSAAAKRRKRKLGSASGQRVENTTMSEACLSKVESGPQTEFKLKSETDHAIWCAVLGKPSPWLINSKFEPVGSFEDKFRDGDRQILLWELLDCWRDGRPIPQWAGDALYNLLFGMAKGVLEKTGDSAAKVGAFVTSRLYVTNSTIERIAVLLEARPAGLQVIADELPGLFANMNRYSSGSDREFWLEAWNGRSHSVERMGRPPVSLDHLLVGITGGLQPDKLVRAFEGDDDGMYATNLLRLAFGAWI